MKKNTILVTIAIIFLFAALVLIILWRNGVVEKIDPAIILAIISLGSYIIDFFNKSNSQKHTGSGDNVGGDKMNSPSHAGTGDIISGDKTEQKHTGTGNNISTNIINHNYPLSNIENSTVIKYPEISTLSAFEIMNTIEKSPLMQRKEIAKKYCGITVKWRIRLKRIISETENEVHLMAGYEEKSIPHVYFHVNTKEYPIIQVAKVGTVYNLTGKISNYESRGFDIKLENLEELPTFGKYHFA